MKTLLSIVLALLVLAGVAAAGWWWYALYTGQDQTYTVALGDVQSGVIISGTVRCKQSAAIGAEIEGVATVKKLLFHEGKEVQAGEKLILFDDGLIQEALAKAQARLAQAQAHLADLKAGARPEEVKKALQGVRLAEAEYELAKREYDDIEQMRKDGAITRAEIDARTMRVKVAAARQVAAEADHKLVKAGTRIEQVNQAIAAVALAQADVRRCQVLKSKYILVAPHKGTITAQEINEGETVRPGQILVQVNNTATKWIEIRGHAQEAQLPKIKPGDTAAVVADNAPDRVFHATVDEILPLVDPTQGTVTVLLKLVENEAQADAGKILIDGGNVDIKLVNEERTNVLCVPTEAVHGEGDQAHVFVRSSGRWKRRSVTIGADDGHRVEITEGLEAGDVVRLG